MPIHFIHIADIHLGAAPDAGTAYTDIRPRELWNTFADVIALCEAEKTDILLVAGDLFHRQPLLRELKEVNQLFSTFTHTKVVLIAGNHDYIRSDSYYRTFAWHENVCPLFSEELDSVVFPEYDMAVYGFSYHSKEISRPRLDTIQAPGRFKNEILLAHGGDDRHIPIRREKVAKNGFAYTALGHIHKPQDLIQNQVCFAGALEPIDKNDTGIHGFIRGIINKGAVRTQFVPFAKRKYLHLPVPVSETMTGRMVTEQLNKAVAKYGVENLYKIILTGFRDPELTFYPEYMDTSGNILEIEDHTRPAWDFQALYRDNRDNLIGKYIELFAGCEEGSIEQQALCEGIQALLCDDKGISR